MNEPDSSDVLAHHVLVDASGLACPLPLLKAKQALNRMQGGEVLQVVATDAGSFRDFQVFAQQSGHQLLRAIDHGDSYQYWIRKK
jgi:tRNA 2-thiouridine synthesizing protein A